MVNVVPARFVAFAVSVMGAVRSESVKVWALDTFCPVLSYHPSNSIVYQDSTASSQVIVELS